MLEAYIRAEQFEKAEAMLYSRLNQRESVRDIFWLGRVQSGQGQSAEADSSLSRAAQRWSGADPDTPEIRALNKQRAAKVDGRG